MTDVVDPDEDTPDAPLRPGGRRGAAARQREKLTALRNDRRARRRGLELLRERRVLAGSALRFYLPEAEGSEAIPVEAQFLVDPEDFPETAAQVLRDHGLQQPAPIDDLRGLVAQVDVPGRSRDDLRALIRELRQAGATASLAYVTPSGPVVKSGGITPERAQEDAPSLQSPAPGGRVRVAVVDTGISSSRRNDGWLQDLETDATRDPLDVLPQNGLLDAAAGHGTFVAGIYEQADPGLELLVTAALGSDGLESEVDVARSIVAAVDEGLLEGGRLVVNLSFGTETEDDEPPLALRAALKILRDIESERGGEVLVVAAAGNDGSTTKSWPSAFAADDDKVVAVAALDVTGQPAEWSNHGDWVRCSAPGEAVMSTFVRGREDRDFDPDPERFRRNAWAYWIGTSFTAPQVGAAVARDARVRDISLRQALEELLAGKPTAPGYGALLTDL